MSDRTNDPIQYQYKLYCAVCDGRASVHSIHVQNRNPPIMPA